MKAGPVVTAEDREPVPEDVAPPEEAPPSTALEAVSHGCLGCGAGVLIGMAILAALIIAAVSSFLESCSGGGFYWPMR